MMNWSRRVVVLVAAGVAWNAAGCEKKKDPPKVRPPVPVTTAVATVKTVPVQLAAIGNVEAFSTISVKSQISGTVVKVHFAEGQEVKRGEVLFTIDRSPFQAALKQAEAVLAKDLAQARNAEDQAQRYASLLKDGIVTREQADTYRTAAEALSATVAADRAAIDNAKIQLDYCTIRSPITGRTGNLAINAGNVIKANETALVSINQISPIFVTFSVPEKHLPDIRKRIGSGGLKVSAVIPADPTATEKGTITFLDNTVDPTTGMFKLKGTFPNGRHALWPGQFVNVTVTLATLPNALVVPQQAVQTGQKGPYVFLLKGDGTVEQRQVKTGETYGGEIVVNEGVAVSDTVVTDGQMRLLPGAKVEVKKPGQSGNGQPGGAPAGKPKQSGQ